MSEEALAQRIDRLESLDEIRQLVAKYSLSLDMRDLDAHVNLFAADIRVSREATGRAHLKRWLDDTLRLQFIGTSHHIGNHIIEFEDADDLLAAMSRRVSEAASGSGSGVAEQPRVAVAVSFHTGGMRVVHRLRGRSPRMAGDLDQ